MLLYVFFLWIHNCISFTEGLLNLLSRWWNSIRFNFWRIISASMLVFLLYWKNLDPQDVSLPYPGWKKLSIALLQTIHAHETDHHVSDPLAKTHLWSDHLFSYNKVLLNNDIFLGISLLTNTKMNMTERK